eukprot:9834-Heterococcus_DN1.PRE.7
MHQRTRHQVNYAASALVLCCVAAKLATPVWASKGLFQQCNTVQCAVTASATPRVATKLYVCFLEPCNYMEADDTTYETTAYCTPLASKYSKNQQHKHLVAVAIDTVVVQIHCSNSSSCTPVL